VLFNVGFYVAERTMYVPVLGVIIVAGWVWEKLAVALGEKRGAGWGGLLLLGASVAMLGSLGATFEDTMSPWKEKRGLYETTLATNGKSFNSMRGLGEHWYNWENDRDKALDYYRMAIDSKAEGAERVLPDWSMAGKIGLGKYIWDDGEKVEGLKEEVGNWLKVGSGSWSYLQARSAHDYGYYLWWWDGRDEVKEEARRWLTAAAGGSEQFTHIFDRERLMMKTNAGCGEWDLGNREEGMKWFEDAVKLGKERVWVGGNGEGFAVSMNNLAVGMKALGREGEAVRVLEDMTKWAGGEVKIDGQELGKEIVYWDFAK
jgi:hypothetical protein